MKRLFILNVLLAIFVIPTYSQGNDAPKNQVIVIETSMGNIEILLYYDTPLHRDNMIKLATENYYKDQIFHRIIKNFMIQGGDPHSVGAPKGQRLGTGGPGYKIPAEFRANHLHKKGVIAAARMGDKVNPNKESSGSQFYIVQGQVYTPEQLAAMQSAGQRRPFTPKEIEIYSTVGGTPHLDGAYTVFGEVIKGMDVVDKIAAVATDNYDRPVEDIVFNIRLK